MPISDDCAAAANISPEWQKIFSNLGLTLVVLQMTRSSKVFQEMDFYEQLGEALEKAEIGRYDSSQWQPTIRHFFHVKTDVLTETLKFLVEYLYQVGLLNDLTIGHYDATDKAWRAHDHGTPIQQ